MIVLYQRERVPSPKTQPTAYLFQVSFWLRSKLIPKKPLIEKGELVVLSPTYFFIAPVSPLAAKHVLPTAASLHSRL